MEVKLWNHDKREREMYEKFAELYAYFVRDIISPKEKEYELDYQKLIGHFKNLASTISKDSTVPSIELFAATAASASTSAAIVTAVCVQNFITAMDSLKLNMVAVDQVHPKMGT